MALTSFCIVSRPSLCLDVSFLLLPALGAAVIVHGSLHKCMVRLHMLLNYSISGKASHTIKSAS